MSSVLFLCLAGMAIIWLMIVALHTAPRARALRPTATKGSTTTIPPARAAYIESRPRDGRPPISCSFVEFDERGDYLDFKQHPRAYDKVRELAASDSPLISVVFVHGWKNSAHSGDVVEFVNFLEDVACAHPGSRVHGTFLAWRGNSFRHALDKGSAAYARTCELFGGPIVDASYARPRWANLFLWLPEQLSYWSRKSGAEYKVSGLPIIRTVFVVGQVARRFGNAHTRSFLVGHSFGALMLEQSFAPATISRLIDEWPWGDRPEDWKASPNPLPFDLTLLINSAAPSIYAKQLAGFMISHQRALAKDGVVGADAPVIASITSEKDSATGLMHKYGNLLAWMMPTLWRRYAGFGEFLLHAPSPTTTGKAAKEIHIWQWFFYRRTPGHNPLLVNMWITPRGASATPAPDPAQMIIPLGAGWQATSVPPRPEWSRYRGYDPVCITPRARSTYWIMRCPGTIMSGHNDIWNKTARETYEQLIAAVTTLRQQKPRPYVP